MDYWRRGHKMSPRLIADAVCAFRSRSATISADSGSCEFLICWVNFVKLFANWITVFNDFRAGFGSRFGGKESRFSVRFLSARGTERSDWLIDWLIAFGCAERLRKSCVERYRGSFSEAGIFESRMPMIKRLKVYFHSLDWRTLLVVLFRF